MVKIPVAIREQRDASYDIVVGHGLMNDLGTLVRAACPASRYAVITDRNVASIYGATVLARLRDASLSAELFEFPAGEPHKTRQTWADLSDRMLAGGFGRDAAVVALGGGVAGDLAGFVAAAYLRGVPYVQVPTSLLAMIDSSIGGKTGVDVPAGKNLIGAFHQPRLVVADLELLSTLPPAELVAGMAEAVKHGAIADADYFAFLERARGAVLARDRAAIERTVTRSIEIKAEVVAADERESGRRAILNFGHTIGHAIEATSGFGMLHGEAVAIGMHCEARLAEAIGVAAAGTATRVRAALAAYGLPLAPPPNVRADELLRIMQLDKKTRDGKVRFALLKNVGAMHGSATGGWTVAAPADAVRAAVTSAN